MEWIILLIIILFLFMRNGSVSITGGGSVSTPSGIIGDGGSVSTGPTFTQSPTGTLYTPPPTPVSQALIPLAPSVAYNPLTPEQAFEKAKNTETNLNPKDFNSPSYTNGARAGILDYTLYIEPSQCQGAAQHLPLSAIISSQALAGFSIAAKLSHSVVLAGPVGAAIAGAITVVTSIVGAIVKHHMQAVARDNNAFCTYVPAMNNALAVFIQGVQQQQLTIEQGIAGLMQLPDVFLQGVGPAKNNSPYCNALCEQLIQLRATCFYWQSQFGDASLQNSSAPSPASNVANHASTLTSSSSSSIAQRRINQCGLRPVRKDYDNTRDYNSDVKDWTLCNKGVN